MPIPEPRQSLDEIARLGQEAYERCSQLSESKEFMAGLEEIKIVSTQRVTGTGAPSMKFTLECGAKRT